MARAPAARRDRVLVDLALQGGGAHGAFTWGVVDRLLEEDWLEIEGISGTSAGAMNAAVLASAPARARAPPPPPPFSRTRDTTPEPLLASTCLPQLFQAVEIDGEPYWDGGFAGNPTLFPLVTELTSDDTILVPVNPIERPGTPRAARDILDRVNEISFNAVALKELKMLALLRKVAD